MGQRDWKNIIFISVCHALALAAVAWLIWVRASPWTIGLGLFYLAVCGLGITGGYHRLFAHPTYRASAVAARVLPACSAPRPCRTRRSSGRRITACTTRARTTTRIPTTSSAVSGGRTWAGCSSRIRRAKRAASRTSRRTSSSAGSIATTCCSRSGSAPWSRSCLGFLWGDPLRRAARRGLPAAGRPVARDVRGELVRALDRHAAVLGS